MIGGHAAPRPRGQRRGGRRRAALARRRRVARAQGARLPQIYPRWTEVARDRPTSRRARAKAGEHARLREIARDRSQSKQRVATAVARALKASKLRNETKAVLRRWHSPLREVAPVGPSALLVHKRQLEAPAGPRCGALPVNKGHDLSNGDGRRWRVRG